MYSEEKFCVYSFEDADGIFYIGQGNSGRPYQFKKSRNQLLTDRLKLGNFQVNILNTGISKKEALQIEHDLILNFQEKNRLLNIQRKHTKSHEDLSFEYCNDLWYISSASKSGLKWREFNRGNSIKAVACRDAGCSSERGYFITSFANTQHQCHRVVWVLYNRRNLNADLVVNHIDSNPSNNSPSNLIATTQSENTFLRNDKSTEGRNCTGLSGITRVGDTWVARGLLDGKEWSKHFSDAKHENSLDMAIQYRESQQQIKEFQKIQLITRIQTKEKELRDAGIN